MNTLREDIQGTTLPVFAVGIIPVFILILFLYCDMSSVLATKSALFAINHSAADAAISQYDYKTMANDGTIRLLDASNTEEDPLSKGFIERPFFKNTAMAKRDKKSSQYVAKIVLRTNLDANNMFGAKNPKSVGPPSESNMFNSYNSPGNVITTKDVTIDGVTRSYLQPMLIMNTTIKQNTVWGGLFGLGQMKITDRAASSITEATDNTKPQSRGN